MLDFPAKMFPLDSTVCESIQISVFVWCRCKYRLTTLPSYGTSFGTRKERKWTMTWSGRAKVASEEVNEPKYGGASAHILTGL
ncbi:hypothetical protein IF2G_10595 [Cordyceps javanica]|nr:hypothetical protein IF2G_10595 [Cordyceps javanica]